MTAIPEEAHRRLARTVDEGNEVPSVEDDTSIREGQSPPNVGTQIRVSIDAALDAIGLSDTGAVLDEETKADVFAELERVGTITRRASPDGEVVTEAPFDLGLVEQVLESPKAISELTLQELSAIDAFVASLDSLSRALRTIEVGGRSLERDAVIAELEVVAGEVRDMAPRPLPQSAVERRKALHRLYDFTTGEDGSLFEIEAIISMLDGHELEGPFRRVVWDGYVEARDREAQLSRLYLSVVLDQWENLSPTMEKRAGERLDLSAELPTASGDTAETAGPFFSHPVSTRQDLWVVALHLGNKAATQRLLEGFGWTRDQVLAALGRYVTEEEWRWVQGVWDSLGALWPELSALQEEELGLPLGSFEPARFEVATSDDKALELRGGYFPVFYARQMMHDASRAVDEAVNVSRMTRAGMVDLATTTPATRSRSPGLARPVDLSWSSIPGHVQRVLHDLAFRSYVRDMANLFQDSRFASVVSQSLGEAYYQTLMPWLRQVARGAPDAIEKNAGWLGAILTGGQNVNAIVSLGECLNELAGDLAEPARRLTSKGDPPVATRHSVAAHAAIVSAPVEAMAFVLTNSEQMSSREEEATTRLTTELDKAIDELAGVRPGFAREMLREAQEAALVLAELSDKLTSTPVWMAAYQQKLDDLGQHVGSGGYSDESLVEAMGEDAHEEAVRFADEAVRHCLPKDASAERAAALRNATGPLLVLQTVLAKMYGLNPAPVDQGVAMVRSASGLAGSVGEGALTIGAFGALWLTFGALSEVLSGRDAVPDEALENQLSRRAIAAPLSTIPVPSRTKGSGVSSDKARPQHARSIIDRAAESAERVSRRLEDGDVGAYRELVGLVSMVFGLPVRHERRTANVITRNRARPDIERDGSADPTENLGPNDSSPIPSEHPRTSH